MKKFLAALLALVMVLSLAACGGGSDSTGGSGDSGTPPPASSDAGDSGSSGGSSEKIDINVIAAQYGQNTGDWWAKFQEDFNKEHEDINLTVEVVSWNDIYTVVNTRISGNAAPDILNIDVFADYQADDLLLPAEDYVSAETYAKMYPAFLEQSVVDGTVWAVPDLASARAMYYNVDILEAAGVEVPTTWDELKAACEKIKAYDSSIYPWGIDMTTDEGQAAFAYYIWNNGGDFTDADGNWTLNSAENVEAIEYAIDLVNSGYTNTDPANETRYTLQDLFGAGKLAMMIGPNSIPTYIAEGGSTINYAFAAIPTNGGNASVSAGVMDRFMCFDNGHSPEKLEAIKTFFDYFYEDARYSDWVLMEGFLPATSAGGEIVASSDPSMAPWVEIVGSCKFYPTAKAEWADVKQGVINVEQQALMGGNVQELLDELQAEIAG
ncbi:extracellular solute-binding protein [uncultured Oscillibacter sp.]|uniref:ABC transporter substrate-binding protein n=1 Tax=uncultured Oscillibacter sp. TaxID=876091 RepID=UPI0025F7AC36|nr:extracellular solute-binding protein [uncultured Oscillibacter sp.]